MTNGRNVICEVQVSQPLLASLDSKSGVRFSHDKVDGDDEEKRGENATLPDHLCISNSCFHTAAEVKVS